MNKTLKKSTICSFYFKKVYEGCLNYEKFFNNVGGGGPCYDKCMTSRNRIEETRGSFAVSLLAKTVIDWLSFCISFGKNQCFPLSKAAFGEKNTCAEYFATLYAILMGSAGNDNSTLVPGPKGKAVFRWES